MEVTVPEYKISPRVSLDPRTTALIVGDMQVDFATPKGKLFVPETRKTIPAIRSLIARARKARVPVFFIQDWHRVNDPEFSIWGEHTVEGTRGARIVPELKPLPDELFIHKWTYDPFLGRTLTSFSGRRALRTWSLPGPLPTSASCTPPGPPDCAAMRSLFPWTPYPL